MMELIIELENEIVQMTNIIKYECMIYPISNEITFYIKVKEQDITKTRTFILSDLVSYKAIVCCED